MRDTTHCSHVHPLRSPTLLRPHSRVVRALVTLALAKLAAKRNTYNVLIRFVARVPAATPGDNTQ